MIKLPVSKYATKECFLSPSLSASVTSSVGKLTKSSKRSESTLNKHVISEVFESSSIIEQLQSVKVSSDSSHPLTSMFVLKFVLSASNGTEKDNSTVLLASDKTTVFSDSLYLGSTKTILHLKTAQQLFITNF